MKRLVSVFAILLLPGLYSCSVFNKTSIIGKQHGYQLVWSDEFDKDGPLNKDGYKAD